MTTTTRQSRILRPKHRSHAIRRDGSFSRHRETWSAESADGQWYAERIEDDGTPWILYWRPTPADPSVQLPHLWGSLPRIERSIARGEPGYDIAVRILRLWGPTRNWV